MVWLALGAMDPGPASAATRMYYIAADEVVWDYAPSFPINLMTDQPFTEEQLVFVGSGPTRIGRRYIKAVFREYNPGFTTPRARGPREEHLGILGPIIRAEVGDTVIVHFRNNTRFPASMHPHGVLYDKASEGAGYADGTWGADKADDAVPPGGRYTYRWLARERSGPGPNDGDSISWLYHSHVDEPGDTNAGLVGPLIIYKRGKMGTVGREFVSLFTVFDENASIYRDANIAEFLPDGVDTEDPDFQEANLKHAVNGLVYHNNTGYHMRLGEKVRWYVMALGTEVDLHTPHWHGVTLLHNGSRMDVAEVLPAATKTFDLMPDNPGMWMFHCHVNDHITAGMMTMFHIMP
jgi:FtsP/CotA-like multicopper oxidase with cupredoxin domain